MPAALSRFRMLDLSRQLPGPFCSMLLADLGMDVLAVYAPTDPMGMGIPLLGRNKRSLTLNLKTPEGREIFTRLAREADVVLEGSRPGAAARLGIDYPRLSEVNPRLVYCSISGYGQDGPYRDRVGHDINYLGFAGVIGLTGTAGGPPAIPGVQIADIGGGALMAAVGILAALWAREETGRGQLVDIAMMDGSVAWQVVHVFRYLLERDEPAGLTVASLRIPRIALMRAEAATKPVSNDDHEPAAPQPAGPPIVDVTMRMQEGQQFFANGSGCPPSSISNSPRATRARRCSGQSAPSSGSGPWPTGSRRSPTSISASARWRPSARWSRIRTCGTGA